MLNYTRTMSDQAYQVRSEDLHILYGRMIIRDQLSLHRPLVRRVIILEHLLSKRCGLHTGGVVEGDGWRWWKWKTENEPAVHGRLIAPSIWALRC